MNLVVFHALSLTELSTKLIHVCAIYPKKNRKISILLLCSRHNLPSQPRVAVRVCTFVTSAPSLRSPRARKYFFAFCLVSKEL